MTSLLQNQAYPLWKRLIILAYFCDRLNELVAQGDDQEVLALIQGYVDGLSGGMFDNLVGQLAAQPLVQLETVLELIIGRISSDFTNQRFRECYQQFMQGLQWTTESSMDDLGRRYNQAHSQFYAAFMSRHEYILENYVVNYVYKTLFPFGPRETRRQQSIRPADRSVSSQCALMIVYYAIVKTLSIGMAALHKEVLGAGHVVQLIQSTSRTFEYSFSYPKRVLQTLAGKGLKNHAGMAMLILN